MITKKINITRPHFPEGYLVNPGSLLTWEHVEMRLSSAVHYWLCSVRPDGRPHTVPKWAVWLDGRLYFDGSPETRHARNIALNPHVSVHLESGENVLILNGESCGIDRPDSELGIKVAQAYTSKYAARGYSPEPDQWDQGGLFVIIPCEVLAWTNFTSDPTKFVLSQEEK
jgi:hypothetical protein